MGAATEATMIFPTIDTDAVARAFGFSNWATVLDLAEYSDHEARDRARAIIACVRACLPNSEEPSSPELEAPPRKPGC
jgi:hypothetical protein